MRCVYCGAELQVCTATRSPCDDQALSLAFHWDSVPNPDAPRGLFILHVFAAANTRTRPVV